MVYWKDVGPFLRPRLEERGRAKLLVPTNIALWQILGRLEQEPDAGLTTPGLLSRVPDVGQAPGFADEPIFLGRGGGALALFSNIVGCYRFEIPQ